MGWSLCPAAVQSDVACSAACGWEVESDQAFCAASMKAEQQVFPLLGVRVYICVRVFDIQRSTLGI